MKKLFALILSLTLVLSLFAGCGAAEKEDDGIFNVAIVQQLDHSSLDEIRIAIEEQLNALDSVTVEIKTYNGQNDASMLNQIGTQIVSDGVDTLLFKSKVAPEVSIQVWMPSSLARENSSIKKSICKRGSPPETVKPPVL